MKYLLDTNVWVDYLTGRYPHVVSRIQQSPPDGVCLSAVVMAELRFGADKSRRKRSNHRLLDALAREVRCIEFDLGAASAYGNLRASLDKRGTPLGANDLLIAAHALSRDLVLITDNAREFRQVRHLKVENWRR